MENHQGTGKEEFHRIQPVTAKDVRAAIRQSNNTKSGGVDEIPMGVLKQVEGEITEMVKEITNGIIRKGKWPGEWKKAEIVPLWKKKGNKEYVKYYRPVAILPAISREVERILINQLKKS
jgi:hypothetical protein